MKVVLLLGVKVAVGYSFKKVAAEPAGKQIGGNTFYWKGQADATSPLPGPLISPLVDEDLYCNTVVGCDGTSPSIYFFIRIQTFLKNIGENSEVAKAFEFELKLLQGSRALGMGVIFPKRGGFL